MHTKQTIAIIEATGIKGAAIAKSLACGNYRLLLKGRILDDLEQLVKEIRSMNKGADIEAVVCATDAGWEADSIILAVPYEAEREITEKIKEVANQKIVISISDPVIPTSMFKGISSAEELQNMLPHSKVVKVFIPAFTANFDKSAIDGQQVDAFIAGNDEEALLKVSLIVSAAGFNPIIAGDLTVSRTLENRQLLCIQ